MITALVVDDQALVRAGFRMILEAQPDIVVVGEAANGHEAVQRAVELRPDVVLMDIRMPQVDGIRATTGLARAGSPARVLVLTTFDLDEYVYAALKAGASGFLLKDVDPPDLVTAVRCVARGEALLAPAITRRLIERYVSRPPARHPPPEVRLLTSREREVLGLIARGRSNAEIALELFLAEATVKTHVTRVLRKLGLRDRVQAVVLAYETGLVEPSGGDRSHQPGASA
jgi:DNA-binding NarL/FixJ family response regulator